MKTVTFSGTEESRSLAKEHAYSEWIMNRFLHYIPDVHKFLKTMDRQPELYIRVNSLKISKPELRSRLVERGFVLEDTMLRDVFSVRKAPHPIGATPEYLLGHYYIQDLSSCVSVIAMDPKNEETNLDMCAAPGGKTSYIAQKMGNTGLLVAMESSKRRMNSIVFNLNRCGVMNTCVYNMDAAKADELGLEYDNILLDAPCTCEGVIQKDVKRKTSRTPEDIEFCSTRQTRLVDTAVNLVKLGGTLVYATCSFAPEENELIVDHVLQKHDAEIIPIPYGSEGLTKFGDLRFDSQVKKTRRFYPHIHSTLGFYVAKIRIG
ncbi:MAG: NOL1/NOP2/sun family putative RNA methylase [Nitrososphaerales archaeon]